MKVVWTATAERGRWSAMEYYIDNDCPEAALKLDENISSTLKRIEMFPRSGRIGRIQETREAMVGDYILVYRSMPDCILITHFIHGTRLYPVS